MRRFFRSKKFIITSAVALVLVASIIAFTVVGSVAAPQSALAGSVVAPIQEFFGNVAEGVGNFFGTFANYEKLEQENADLEKYLNLFGYNPKYGISGKPIGSVTYKPQHYDPPAPLYEL